MRWTIFDGKKIKSNRQKFASGPLSQAYRWIAHLWIISVDDCVDA